MRVSMAVQRHGRRTIAGSLRAGYIFSILPDSVKSFLLGRLSPREAGRLDRALGRIGGLTNADRMEALGSFTHGMRRLREEREAAVDRSLVATLALVAGAIALAAVYSIAMAKNPDGAFAIIDFLVTHGGMHLILLPCLWTVIRVEYRTAPLRALFGSQNIALDIGIGIVAGIALGALFVQPGPRVHSTLPAGARFAAGMLAVTVGPAVEELFFRFILFYRVGRRHGMAAGAALSVCAFVAAHLPHTLPLAAAYLVAGGALCALYAGRRSLLPALTAHAVSNAAVLLL